MKGARYSTFALVCCTLFFGACRKNDPQEEAPPISSYRTYELVCAAVKADPWGGQILLCKGSPVDRRTSFLQLMSAEGDLGPRIDLDVLPRTAENITFQQSELLYTDFAPLSDGSILVVGIGRQVEQEDRLHVIVHRVGRDGAPIGAPFRRYLTAGGSVHVNIDGATKDLDGLPRLRALCDLHPSGDLLLAARWETASAAGIRLFRFAIGGSTGAFAQADIVLTAPDDRLHALTCAPNGRVVVVTDAGLPGTSHTITAHGYQVSSTDWIGEGTGSLQDQGQTIINAEPQQMFWAGDSFVLVGTRPNTGDASVSKPFVARFGTATDISGEIRVLSGLSASDRTVACYCAAVVNGQMELLTQAHESSALPPFFDGDITSDLETVALGWPGLSLGTTSTLVSGQGLRAIGLFVQNGERVLIGSQHPYLNAGFIHTFRLVLE
ncbi:MAG: hypothetical protein IPG10_04030 [Flavobacteriales bacterium]|jgi:hypothetical protein|nr:hypothetical protein [Flavobacteriales bacterium]MBK6755145.1 hypothetical protein [Flavobacteriales bacterium]MBK7268017.1 hypothetical protein [Flavobacteriales bacterium]MBK7751324.1 hypothetical protein [Flavobacteriales bacterium]MBK9073671.1 hypothetical protein [Flavobacteriales bacterium]